MTHVPQSGGAHRLAVRAHETGRHCFARPPIRLIKRCRRHDVPAVRGSLMATLDKLNDRYGRGTVLVANAGREGMESSWTMRQNLLTPQYTTNWGDLPVANA